MVWMWLEYTAVTLPASPVWDSVVNLLSTLSADYSSWRGAVLQNTSEPLVLFDNKEQAIKNVLLVYILQFIFNVSVVHFKLCVLPYCGNC